jgi:hypothetical protein
MSMNEIAEPVEGFPGETLSNIFTAETRPTDSERWLAFLREYTTVEPECEVRDSQIGQVSDTCLPQISAPLQTLPASPWRSVGGYLDYQGWAARDRFLELDKAIARIQYPHERAH